MRTRLLLALVAVPVLAAALPRDAAAQRHRDRVVRVHRDGRGYRDRIYIPSHRYKEPSVRYRYDDRRYRDDYRYRNEHRYRDEYRYRDQYRYRDRDRYRYEYRRRHTNLVDLILLAAAEARYRDRYGHRSGRRIRHGVYIDLY
ncbi:MAG: hypothetical protein ACJ8J0_28730 [Longimicrobiaceae bacterium]